MLSFYDPTLDLSIEQKYKYNALITLIQPNSKELQSQIKYCTGLTRKQKEELWDAFQRFFEKEFNHFDQFDEWLMTDRWTILFYSPCDNLLKGFIIIKIITEHDIKNENVTVNEVLQTTKKKI